MDKTKLTKKQREEVVGSLMFGKEKRNGEIKGRIYADGKKSGRQQERKERIHLQLPQIQCS